MNKKRPVNLELSTIAFPVTAIVSITHRISGVALLAGVLILMWMLDTSLESEDGFVAVKSLLALPWVKLIIWFVLVALAYHLVAGIRHLIMDMGVGESLQGGRLGAKLTILLAVVLIVLAGVWLWLPQ